MTSTDKKYKSLKQDREKVVSKEYSTRRENVEINESEEKWYRELGLYDTQNIQRIQTLDLRNNKVVTEEAQKIIEPILEKESNSGPPKIRENIKEHFCANQLRIRSDVPAHAYNVTIAAAARNGDEHGRRRRAVRVHGVAHTPKHRSLAHPESIPPPTTPAPARVFSCLHVVYH